MVYSLYVYGDITKDCHKLINHKHINYKPVHYTFVVFHFPFLNIHIAASAMPDSAMTMLQ